ncbi:MAG: ATP-binding protein [Myxococcota bacterium]
MTSDDLLETSSLPPASRAGAHDRAHELFRAEYDHIHRRTDHMFASLLLVQWGVAIALALTTSPRVWAGSYSVVHSHVVAAIGLGGLITVFPVVLVRTRPGQPTTRYVLACAQMAWSGLLVHLTGGRIETHFHIFGSLAFLAFYRDWWVLVPATIVTAADHFLRGVLWPESIYGVVNPEWWRFLEHAGWVVFIDVFLARNCVAGRRDLERNCLRQACLEVSEAALREASVHLEERVATRTAELTETISELGQAKAEIEAREKETFEFLSNVPLGVYVVDQQGRLVFVNGHGERFLQDGFEIGAPLLDLTFPLLRAGRDEPYPATELPIRRALEGEHAQCQDCDVEAQSRLRVSIRAAPIQDEQGNARYALVTFEDITEREELHAELLQAQKLESIGQLAAGIAHEINTPMQYLGDNAHFLQRALSKLFGVVDAYRDLLDRNNTGPDLEASIATVDKNAKLSFLRAKVPKAVENTIEGVGAVSEIVRAMKDFSHPGSNEKTPTDINRAIETTMTVSRNTWKYVAEVNLDLDPSLPHIPALPGELNQVLLNLIVNATHAIEANSGDTKGSISVRTRESEDAVEIDVEDSGCGMPPELLGRIFDPFFTTKEVGKGTGQGLAIARSIIADKHGGRLTVRSTLGEGTCFTIALPTEI